MRAWTIAVAAVLAATPAAAQVERLPEQSRAERQSQEINRSIMLQEQIRRQNQQTQFEINQLRNQPVIGGPTYTIRGGRGCPPTSIGC